MKQIELRKVKKGDVFKRKPDAKKVFIKEHYNRKSWLGPANFCCIADDDIGRSIFLAPATMVFVGFDY